MHTKFNERRNPPKPQFSSPIWKSRYALLLTVVALPLLLHVTFGTNMRFENVSIAASGLTDVKPSSVKNPVQPTVHKSSSTGGKNETNPLSLRLKELESTLATLSEEYTDAHPDIIWVREQIAETKAQLEEERRSGARAASLPKKEEGTQSGRRLAHLGEQASLETQQAEPDKTPVKQTEPQPQATEQSTPTDTLLTEEKFEVAETARLLAVLLDSGRVVVGRAQTTLNNPRLEYKGFSSSAFESQLRKEFLSRTGQDLRNLAPAAMPERAKPLLVKLAFLMQKAVQDVQPLINTKGIGFKGFIPATFATKVAGQFSKEAGLKLRQIGPPGIQPRNPNNRPDQQEEQALLAIQKSHPRVGDHVVEQQLPDHSVRVLLPLFYNKQCLACHGKPKNEVDISGYEKEGFKEGDLGGAISVLMSFDKQLAKAER